MQHLPCLEGLSGSTANTALHSRGNVLEGRSGCAEAGAPIVVERDGVVSAHVRLPRRLPARRRADLGTHHRRAVLKDYTLSMLRSPRQQRKDFTARASTIDLLIY